MPWIEWYNALEKPSRTPAPATIGLIWQILYPVILVSFGFVFVQIFRGKVGWLVGLPFAVKRRLVFVLLTKVEIVRSVHRMTSKAPRSQQSGETNEFVIWP